MTKKDSATGIIAGFQHDAAYAVVSNFPVGRTDRTPRVSVVGV